MPTQMPAFYKTRVGEFVVTALHDGVIVRDRPAGFIKGADEAEVEAVFAAAGCGAGKLTLTFTGFSIETPGGLILIDPGFGENGPPTTGRIGANLVAAGYAAESVKTILISHFHGDHISGLITKDGKPAYPGATVHVPQPEWDYWMDDEKMAGAPQSLQGNFGLCRKVFGILGDKVRKFGWGDEVISNVNAVNASGHTPGMTAFRIASNNETLLYIADVTNNPTIFARRPNWQAAFDINGDDTIATRHRIFGEIAAANTRVAYFHAPFPGLGHIARAGDAYVYVPQIWGAEPA